MAEVSPDSSLSPAERRSRIRRVQYEITQRLNTSGVRATVVRNGDCFTVTFRHEDAQVLAGVPANIEGLLILQKILK